MPYAALHGCRTARYNSLHLQRPKRQHNCNYTQNKTSLVLSMQYIVVKQGSPRWVRIPIADKQLVDAERAWRCGVQRDHRRTWKVVRFEALMQRSPEGYAARYCFKRSKPSHDGERERMALFVRDLRAVQGGKDSPRRRPLRRWPGTRFGRL